MCEPFMLRASVARNRRATFARSGELELRNRT
jgi:hypothetical protein